MKDTAIQRMISIWKYEGVIRKAILALKYRFASDIATELSNLAINELKNCVNSRSAFLVPIPLHDKRQRWRGFNQTEEIGEKIAQQMKWECARLLIRISDNPQQARLHKEERLRNISGIFAVNTKFSFKEEERSPIILFDDVVTTGATINEAAKILKNGGVNQIWGMSIAR